MIPILYVHLCLFCCLDFPSSDSGFGLGVDIQWSRFVSFRFNARDRGFNSGGIADMSCHMILLYCSIY